MLAKKFKLPLQNHRPSWKNNAIARKGEFFIAKITPNDLDFSRFGIIISSRAVKSAVKRNQLKRIFFNFVRLNKLERVLGKDFLFIALKKNKEPTKSQIENELSLLLNINQ